MYVIITSKRRFDVIIIFYYVLSLLGLYYNTFFSLSFAESTIMLYQGILKHAAYRIFVLSCLLLVLVPCFPHACDSKVKTQTQTQTQTKFIQHK